MGDLDAPGVSDGTEDGLLVVPPDPPQLKVVLPAEHAGCRCGDPTVHQDQLEPPGDALPGQVLQHQLTGSVLVGGGRDDQRTQRESGHIDRHDALGALWCGRRDRRGRGRFPRRSMPRGRDGCR